MQVCVSIVSLTIRCHSVHQSLRAESVTRNITHAFTTTVEPPPQTPPAHRSTTQAPQNQIVPHTQTTPQNQTVRHTQTTPQNQTVPHTQTIPQNQTVPQNAATTTAHTTTTHSKDTVATSTSLNTLSKSVCLLKTAIANVSAGETTVEGHILFDEGAQRSFITQELANQLQLQPTHHENISVSSFGEQVSTPRRLPVATVLIQTGHIPISVLLVPKLAAPICNSIRAHLDKLPYLQELPLAHPVTSEENFHISILIGADYYWQFIQDRIMRGDGPTAVESRLGYLLSGPLPSTQLACITCSQVLVFPASLKIQTVTTSGQWNLWALHQ